MIAKKLYAPKFSERLAGRGRPLIAAHRGSAGGNIVPNTIAAFTAALRQGADMVECDIERTRDGRLVLFHGTHERMYLGSESQISEMTYAETVAFKYFNSNDNSNGQSVEDMEDAFRALKGKTLINIDRGWDFWDLIVEGIERQDMSGQILLKSPPRADLLAKLESFPVKYMYMPILRSLDDYRSLSGFDINLVAAELIFDSPDSEIVSSDFIGSLKRKGLLVWANSLKLNDTDRICAEFDDDVSIMKGAEHGWGKLLDMGFDIIQTDWPALLRAYLEERYGVGAHHG